MFLKQRKHRLQNASIRSIIFMYFYHYRSGSQYFYRSFPLRTAVRTDVLCTSGGKPHSYQPVRPDNGLCLRLVMKLSRLPVLRRD